METTTKKDKAERDTICGLTHLNQSQFLIPCYQDFKKLICTPTLATLNLNQNKTTCAWWNSNME